MISVIIKNNGEQKVIQLTYENLFKELKDVSNSELLVADDWLDPLPQIDNAYVCFVEADCLVNSGYFSSMIGLFKKNKYFRKLAMLSSGVGVNNWSNKFYGYRLGNNYTDGVIPITDKKSTAVYPLQIGYVPGSIIRKTMLIAALNDLNINNTKSIDLVQLSAKLSLQFWKQGDGNRVHINPNTTYVTTESYVNDIGMFGIDAGNVLSLFKKEVI